MVVAGGIEPLALLGQALRVEVGVENRLLVVERAGEVGAVRSEDRRAAAAERVEAGDLVAQREVRPGTRSRAGNGTG